MSDTEKEIEDKAALEALMAMAGMGSVGVAKKEFDDVLVALQDMFKLVDKKFKAIGVEIKKVAEMKYISIQTQGAPFDLALTVPESTLSEVFDEMYKFYKKMDEKFTITWEGNYDGPDYHG